MTSGRLLSHQHPLEELFGGVLVAVQHRFMFFPCLFSAQSVPLLSPTVVPPLLRTAPTSTTLASFFRQDAYVLHPLPVP